jgi:hypothetical protein
MEKIIVENADSNLESDSDTLDGENEILFSFLYANHTKDSSRTGGTGEEGQ